MMDVFMIGILVSVVKLTEMATIVPGTSLFAFVALIFVLAAAQAALDPDLVWERSVPLPPGICAGRRCPGEKVLGCDVCELVVPEQAALRDQKGRPAVRAAPMYCTGASRKACSAPGRW
jgi:paraquat-inducible protein A